MKKHLEYLNYVLRHKWFVFIYCRSLKVPLWASIIHDWQKFTPTEWKPYVMSFYGPWKYKDRPAWLVKAFDRAWLHHQHHGPHHWQYWILENDYEGKKVLDMPDRYRREMLADWHGAGHAINGKNNTSEWYQANQHKMQLHQNTRTWIEMELWYSPEEKEELMEMTRKMASNENSS